LAMWRGKISGGFKKKLKENQPLRRGEVPGFYLSQELSENKPGMKKRKKKM